MVKTLKIDGKEIKMKSTALTIYKYNGLFGTDLMMDMNNLKEAIENKSKGKDIGEIDLRVFMQLAYVMAKSADNSIPDSHEEWLDTFEGFSIYEALPQIMDMWNESNKTNSVPKKK